MSDLSPAEELRRAAARIREVAGNATPGPWLDLDHGDRIIRDPGDDFVSPVDYVVDEPLVSNPANGRHFELWDPIVAVLVAKALEDLAEEYADHDEQMQQFVAAPNGDDPETAAPLYLLARAINGSADAH